MKVANRWLIRTQIFICLFVIAGCATTSLNSQDTTAQKDPFENINRLILDFNLESDRLILKPVAKVYRNTFPDPVRKGANNFFSNLWEPMTIVNDLLQGKIDYAGQNTMRFFLNTTVGILGIFDVATHLDLPRRREDFGQTLAVWGVSSGPYIVLPFLGPSNLRDTAGLIPQWVYADAVTQLNSPESYIAGGIRLVDARSNLFGLDDILDLQPDKYLFLRENYRQSRINQIYDGNPPENQGEDSSDELIDQLLEE